MLERPELFQSVLALSPATGWDNKWLFAREKESHKAHLALKNRVWLSVGTDEWPEYTQSARDFFKLRWSRDPALLLHEIAAASAADRRQVSGAPGGGAGNHRAMRWLSGVSLIPALPVLLALALAAGWRAAAATEPRAAPGDLAEKLVMIARRAKGRVGVSVIHVESGREVATGGDAALPLYSVFKLPLAVVVLKAIEREELSLDQKAVVEARDVAPGAASNTRKWRNLPVTMTVRQLLEFSLIDSDNTSSDKLLELVGGPAGLTRQIRLLGFSGIDIRGSTKETATAPRHPNQGSALSLARLLSGLQRGVVLRPAQLAVLWGLMGRSQTGKHRLPASLPPGTPVVEKTGSGKAGSATNDVGVVTLPNEQGHLAIAVLITGSALPAAEQERLIAEIGRTSFDAYAIQP